MRAVGEEIEVQVRGGQPQRLRWHGRAYAVRAVLDSWRWAGRWWLRERPRDYWLLDARGLTAEVYRVQGPGGPSWVLARVAD